MYLVLSGQGVVFGVTVYGVWRLLTNNIDGQYNCSYRYNNHRFFPLQTVMIPPMMLNRTCLCLINSFKCGLIMSHPRCGLQWCPKCDYGWLCHLSANWLNIHDMVPIVIYTHFMMQVSYHITTLTLAHAISKSGSSLSYQILYDSVLSWLPLMRQVLIKLITLGDNNLTIIDLYPQIVKDYTHKTCILCEDKVCL